MSVHSLLSRSCSPAAATHSLPVQSQRTTVHGEMWGFSRQARARAHLLGGEAGVLITRPAPPSWGQAAPHRPTTTWPGWSVPWHQGGMTTTRDCSPAPTPA